MDRKQIIHFSKLTILSLLIASALFALARHITSYVSQRTRHAAFRTLAMEHFPPTPLQNITYDPDGIAIDSLSSILASLESEDDLTRTSALLRDIFNDATSDEQSPFHPYAEDACWALTISFLLREDTASATNTLRLLQEEFPLSPRLPQADTLINNIHYYYLLNLLKTHPRTHTHRPTAKRCLSR